MSQRLLLLVEARRFIELYCTGLFPLRLMTAKSNEGRWRHCKGYSIVMVKFAKLLQKCPFNYRVYFTTQVTDTLPLCVFVT